MQNMETLTLSRGEKGGSEDATKSNITLHNKIFCFFTFTGLYHVTKVNFASKS